MRTALREGETITREGAANLQRNIETVGGHLYLTSERLVFEAHRFNLQRGTTVVELGDVLSLVPTWTKFLGVFPVFPNSLSVHTRQGQEHRLVLFGRSVWAHAIGMARAT